VTFQAYLDTVKAKTGLGPDEFRRLADEKGLTADGVKVGQIVTWLKEDFDLGQGHAMAIVATLKRVRSADGDAVDLLDKHFRRGRAHWRTTYDDLVAMLKSFGPVQVAPTQTYISLLKGRDKFAIVQVTADWFDVGIKLKGEIPTERFAASGAWNAMVTHRVRLSDPAQVDKELLAWLRRAYDAA
jgi:Domain of unknown function (DUF4287)/Domain of unknown function (DUF5655)